MSDRKTTKDINDELRKACKEGDLINIKLLLNKGANIHHKDIHFGNSPIIIACFNDNIQVIE
jgi:ankyrin repeat protein